MDTFVAIYKTATGQITKRLVIPDDYAMSIADANTGSGEAYITLTSDFDPAVSYVDTVGLVLVDRPLLSTVATWSATALTANGVATVTLGSSLPSNTIVRFISTPDAVGAVPDQTVADGSFSFSTLATGAYIVNTFAFPYQDTTTTITAS